MAEVTIWGIHGGKTGDADTLFLKKNLVGIGWAKLGDLSRLAPSRDPFDAAYKGLLRRVHVHVPEDDDD